MVQKMYWASGQNKNLKKNFGWFFIQGGPDGLSGKQINMTSCYLNRGPAVRSALDERSYKKLFQKFFGSGGPWQLFRTISYGPWSLNLVPGSLMSVTPSQCLNSDLIPGLLEVLEFRWKKLVVSWSTKNKASPSTPTHKKILCRLHFWCFMRLPIFFFKTPKFPTILDLSLSAVRGRVDVEVDEAVRAPEALK